MLPDGALEEGHEGAEGGVSRQHVERFGGVYSLEIARHERQRLVCVGVRVCVGVFVGGYSCVDKVLV